MKAFFFFTKHLHKITKVISVKQHNLIYSENFNTDEFN